MNYLFWIIGFGTLWAGLNRSNDEAVLIVASVVGSLFVLAGLLTSPTWLQITVELVLVLALFNICMECVKRGDRG
jgi:uncharacterized protein (DUF983 family)